MPKYKLEKYEQETIILFNEQDDTAEVYTFNKPFIRKLKDTCKSNPDRFTLTEKHSSGAHTFTVPKQYVTVNKPMRRNPNSNNIVKN